MVAAPPAGEGGPGTRGDDAREGGGEITSSAALTLPNGASVILTKWHFAALAGDATRSPRLTRGNQIPESACVYQRDAAEQTHTHTRWVFYPLLSPLLFFFSSFTPNNEHDQVTGRLFIQQVTPPLWMH